MESTEAVPWDEIPGEWDETSKELDPTMRFNDSHLLSIIVYSILMVFSAVSNVTFLVKLMRLRHKDRYSSINLLLLNLAVADLFVTFLFMPVEIAWASTVHWKGGDFLCRVMAFFRTFGHYLSGFVLVCISLDRYFAVFKPCDKHGVHKRAKLMLIVAWSASTIFSSPQAIIFHVESHPDFIWYKQCVTFNSFLTHEMELLYRIFAIIAMYGFPLVMMLGSHLCILWKIYSVKMQGTTDNIEMLSRAKMRTLKLTVTIVATFCLCWTPYYIMCFWYLIDSATARDVDQRIQKALFLFACTNSCFNPLVYGYFYLRKQREAYASHSYSDRSQDGTPDCRVRLKAPEDTRKEKAVTVAESFRDISVAQF